MPHNRFFVHSELAPGTHVTMEPDEAHHIRDVMRCHVGDTVELVNGQGALAIASLASLSKKEVTLSITSLTTVAKPAPRLFLALPLLRPSHMDWAIEKAVELGIDCLILYPADQSEKKEIYNNVLQRAEKLIVSATKQSGRLFLPELTTAASLEEVLHQFPFEVVWAEKDADSIPIKERCNTCSSPLLLLSGPEKGWSSQEKALLRNRAPPVLLSENILRAETAAIVLVAFTA